MVTKASRDYSHKPHTHPAAFGLNVTPSTLGATLFQPASRGIIFDQSGTVELVLAGYQDELMAPIVGVSGDISMAAGGVITSTTSGKFSALAINNPVTIKGFTNSQNNGLFTVSAASGTSITIVAPGSTKTLYTIAETPSGAAVSIQGPYVGTQDTVTITVIGGVLYPISVEQWVTGGNGQVTTGCILW
jgi:hypothetical protein